MMSSAWFINALCDVSFGVINSWPVPRPMYPRNKDSVELINPRRFIWDATCGPNDTFLFQLSTNKDFADLLFETETKDHGLQYTIAEGTYYWRLCINVPEPNRKWSKTFEFSVEDLSKRRSWQPGDPRVRFKGKNYEDKEPKPAQ
jgi:hypothetical protein